MNWEIQVMQCSRLIFFRVVVHEFLCKLYCIHSGTYFSFHELILLSGTHRDLKTFYRDRFFTISRVIRSMSNSGFQPQSFRAAESSKLSGQLSAIACLKSGEYDCR